MLVLKKFKIVDNFNLSQHPEWLTTKLPETFDFIDDLIKFDTTFNKDSSHGSVISVGMMHKFFADIPVRMRIRYEKMLEHYENPANLKLSVDGQEGFINYWEQYNEFQKDLHSSNKYSPQQTQFILNAKKYEILNTFQSEYIGYTFKDLGLLETALKPLGAYNEESHQFQRFEFLGDALIESMSLYIARKVLLKLKKSSSPEILHSIKVMALNNYSLASMLIFHRFHRFIMNYPDAERIKKYIKLKKFNAPFKQSTWEEDLQAPKSLGDIMEAICASIFLDGGWFALLETFGRMVSPTIFFVCKYFDQIAVDLIHDVKRYYDKKGMSMPLIYRPQESACDEQSRRGIRELL